MMLRKNNKLVCFVTRCAICAFLIFSFCSSMAPVNAQAPADPPPIQLSKYLNTYVSVMDPNIVEDVFGKRISDRFVVIQVTISNKNTNFQFLIHDVSLDLKNVFGQKIADDVDKEAAAQCQSCAESCMSRGQPRSEETPKQSATRFDQCKANCGRVCSSGRIRFELSSLELSLIRGVAEKGQAQDRRNKILRYLEGAGTVAAAFIGFAGIGPKYSDFMALYNGDFLAAYRHVYPDFTINQMNRLSDSAYKSNTLIPKEQARVIVAFIPQAMFLRPEQRKNFRKDPTSLYPENSPQPFQVDFRKAVALVDGNFVTEIENLPPLVTGVRIDPEQALEFLKKRPIVKGYILGQFLQGSEIDLANAPEGMELTVDKDAKPEDGKLFFVIQSDRTVSRNTQLNFRVFNKQGSQTISQGVSYMPPVPTLKQPDPPLTGAPGATDVKINLSGSGFLSGVTTLVVDESTGVHVVSEGVTDNPDGSKSFSASLKIDANATGVVKLKVKNGTTVSNAIDFTIK